MRILWWKKCLLYCQLMLGFVLLLSLQITLYYNYWSFYMLKLVHFIKPISLKYFFTVFNSIDFSKCFVYWTFWFHVLDVLNEYIDSSKLYSLIRNKDPIKKSVLIIDCRSATDFKLSHLMYSDLIHIPQSAIIKG